MKIGDCKLVYDFGSNTGISIMRFKQLFPDARIYGFEPSVTAFNLMEKNLRENDLGGVKVHNVFLSDHYGPVRYDTLSSSYGNSAYTMSDDVTTTAKSIDVKDLFINEVVDLVKMDVEESEYTILKRLLEYNQFDKIRNMIIEFHNIDVRYQDLNYWYRILSKFYDMKIVLLDRTNNGVPYMVAYFKSIGA
jgi:FkbM family methyltransferase